MCKIHKPNNRKIDPCLSKLIGVLNTKISDDDAEILACCCGHGKYPLTIVAKERALNDTWVITEWCSGKVIIRKSRFYKRDRQGYYYIPEVIER